MTTTHGHEAPPTTTTAALQPAAAARFRQRSQEGEVFLLPGCGLPARLRRPGLMGLIAAGATANPVLSPELVRMMAFTRAPNGKAPSEAEQIKDFQQNIRAYLEVAARCLVEPRLVLDRAPDYDAGEIGPADLPDRDLVWIYWAFSQGEAAQIETFRVGRGASRA